MSTKPSGPKGSVNLRRTVHALAIRPADRKPSDSLLQKRNRAGPKDLSIRAVPCTHWLSALRIENRPIPFCKNETERAQRICRSAPHRARIGHPPCG